MLSRLFRSSRPAPSVDGVPRAALSRGAPSAPIPGTRRPTPAAGAVRVGGAASGALPHAGELADEWRAQVARAGLALRDRFPAMDAQREHAEQLLVRLGVDLDMVVQQPPAAAQQALAVAGDPGCELPALVAAVERDPALVRGLMRHASSALHGAGRPPASIDDAVRRLGGQGVQIAVLAGLAEALLARGGGRYAALAQDVWAHMVRTGPVARALAPAFGVPAGEAMLLGLVHDVGKLVLFDLVSALRQEGGREVVVPPALGAEALRALHEPLGGLALLRWGVAPRLAWAVAHHHRLGEGRGADPHTELLFVAERLELARTYGQPVELAAWHQAGALTVELSRLDGAIGRLRAA